MSRNRMSQKEEELFLLGMTLQNAVDGMTGDVRRETFKRWEWLVTFMEISARAHPETVSVSQSVRRLLPDPRIPF